MSPSPWKTGRPRIMAIDPGPEHSGLCILAPGEPIVTLNSVPNAALLADLDVYAYDCDLLAVEWIESYGARVGAEVFHTCRVVGRLEQAWLADWHKPDRFRLISRPEVGMHLCAKRSPGDAAIRRVLMDRYGGDSSIKKPKRCPKADKLLYCPPECPKCGGDGVLTEGGPLCGVSGHGWSALALAVTCLDREMSNG